MKRFTHTSRSLQMDEIVNLCKKRGFVYQSSEIYNSIGGFYDFGPLGVELKNNIKRIWWKDMVQRRDDMYGLDSSIIASSLVWKASGHIAGFTDPMVDCLESKQRFRADQVFWAPVVTIADEVIGYVCVQESENMVNEAFRNAKMLAKSKNYSGELKSFELKDLMNVPEEVYPLLPSPVTGKPGLTKPREFNLMFKTSVGAISDESSVAYLRPETAQGIFTNFHLVQRSSRAKIPFGIAQIGKAFRNELTPRNFIFRSREFEQMEIEYFISPEDKVWEESYKTWITTYLSWLTKIGIPSSYLSLQVHSNDKLAHYAKACTDIIFRFPFGEQELMGIAARGNFDLTQHSEHSGKNLEYFDSAHDIKYLPHVIEPSLGVERLFLALLVSNYKEESLPNNDKRTVLSLPPALAPIKVAVFPLLSNKVELQAFAKTVAQLLRSKYVVEFDSSGAIGRRYRRADEIGIPFCVTIDFDSLKDNTVTIRYRDSMEQRRINVDEILTLLGNEIVE